MSILITGTGLVGPHIAQILIDEYDERPVIFGTLREPAQVSELADHCDVVVGDIRNIPDLLAAFHGREVEAVIHTAALMTDPCDENPYLGLETNVVGTANVLEASRFSDVRRVVFASTIGVHAEVAGGEPGIRETDPVGLPANLDPPKKRLYLGTKIAAEQVGRAYAGLYGIEFPIVRLTATYGPTVRHHRGTAGVIQDAVEGVARGESVVMQRRWSGTHAITYVKDAARALILAAKANDFDFESYNISAKNAYSLDDVATTLTDLTGHEVRVAGETDLSHVGRTPDLSRAASLGWEPQYDLREGLSEYLEWSRRRI